MPKSVSASQLDKLSASPSSASDFKKPPYLRTTSLPSPVHSGSGSGSTPNSGIHVRVLAFNVRPEIDCVQPPSLTATPCSWSSPSNGTSSAVSTNGHAGPCLHPSPSSRASASPPAMSTEPKSPASVGHALSSNGSARVPAMNLEPQSPAPV